MHRGSVSVGARIREGDPWTPVGCRWGAAGFRSAGVLRCRDSPVSLRRSHWFLRLANEYGRGVDTAREAELASALRLSVMRLSRRMRQERSSRLTPTQIAALATLERHGPMTLGEIAAHERVQPPSMTRVIAHLAVAGLVERRPHPTDGRQVIAEATDAGRALLDDDRRRRDEWLTDRLADLSPEDIAALNRAAPILDVLAGS
jgi:DNA-binding MarR family transcriptional regulator